MNGLIQNPANGTFDYDRDYRQGSIGDALKFLFEHLEVYPPGYVPPPVPVCGCEATENARFWVSPLAPAPFGTPIFDPVLLNRIDLAPTNIVTSANSHSSGTWRFEFEVNHIYANLVEHSPIGADNFDAYGWLYGGLMSCSDLTEVSPSLRSVLLQHGISSEEPLEYSYEVNSTFSDTTSNVVPDAAGLASVRVCMRVNLDTGAWAFFDMAGDEITSGLSPEMVGLPMLACVQSITGTSGYYHVQSLYLLEEDFEIAVSPGGDAWMAPL